LLNPKGPLNDPAKRLMKGLADQFNKVSSPFGRELPSPFLCVFPPRI
jgi:hypothetical protein